MASRPPSRRSGGSVARRSGIVRAGRGRRPPLDIGNRRPFLRQRLGLEATGKGKARRISRAAVESICDRTRRGIGPQTVNHYVRAIRGFLRWLVKSKRATSNPLDTLNTCTDVRRGRRELTVEELRLLLDATLKNQWTFRGLVGRDRFCLYLTASTTGFRARALAHLTPADFDLNETSPTVTLPARFNKSRKLPQLLDPAQVTAFTKSLKDLDCELIYGDFAKCFPPTLIQGGTRELFLSHFVRLYRAIDGAGGVAVLDLYEGMPHVFQLRPELADAVETRAALKKMAAFLKSRLGD